MIFTLIAVSGVQVNQRLYFQLSTMDFPLLVWYQQAGRWRKAAESRKYIDVSRRWSHYFTLTPVSEELIDQWKFSV
jgi:hypothetical protein